MTAEIKSGEERIQRFAKKLGSLNSIDTFDSDLEAAKANVNDIRDELQVKEANKHTFKQFIDKMEKSLKTPGDSSCPTCSRSFGTQSECEEVITALKEEIERVPQKVCILFYCNILQPIVSVLPAPLARQPQNHLVLNFLSTNLEIDDKMSFFSICNPKVFISEIHAVKLFVEISSLSCIFFPAAHFYIFNKLMPLKSLNICPCNF